MYMLVLHVELLCYVHHVILVLSRQLHPCLLKLDAMLVLLLLKAVSGVHAAGKLCGF